MDVETLTSRAAAIRAFCRELFGSHLLAHLEEELARTRADYETRLQERDRSIADLESRVQSLTSKVDRYELVIIPLSSPLGQMMSAPSRAQVSRNFKATSDAPARSTWDEIRDDHDRKQAEEAEAERLAAVKEQ